jgi:nucleotide-binding universal stress UspA family protein
MKFPTSILLAVDGSAAADRAMEVAVALRGSSDVAFHVLHVVAISHWSSPSIMREDQLRRFWDEGQQLLDEQLTKLADLGVQEPPQHLRMGRVSDEVLRLRDELNSDLIVVGNRGMNAFSRVLLGSDAEQIMRHAPCPILVVRFEEKSHA